MKKLFQYVLFVAFGAVPMFAFAQAATSINNNLYQGLKTAEVTYLQQRLQGLGFFAASQAPTGFFGPMTKKAVQDFQSANGIITTGFVGSLTRNALAGVPKGSSAVKTTVYRSRAECLAAIAKTQSAAVEAAKKTLADDNIRETSARDKSLTAASDALSLAKSVAGGPRDATFVRVRSVEDTNVRVTMIQAAIDTYTLAVAPAIKTEAAARKVALVAYDIAASKVQASYTAAIQSATVAAQAARTTCPAK